MSSSSQQQEPSEGSCCDIHQPLGSQIAGWVIRLWSAISLLGLCTRCALPLKWASLWVLWSSTARWKKKKTGAQSMTWTCTGKQKSAEVGVGSRPPFLSSICRNGSDTCWFCHQCHFHPSSSPLWDAPLFSPYRAALWQQTSSSSARAPFLHRKAQPTSKPVQSLLRAWQNKGPLTG